MYFLFLSSVVHVLALQQFIQTNEGEANVPKRLINSSEIHLKILSSLEKREKQYSKLLVTEIHFMLSSCLSRFTSNRIGEIELSCHVLYLYRWTDRGTGMIKMSELDAEREWMFLDSPRDKLRTEPPSVAQSLIPKIYDICSPEKGMCEDGYFDLSISVKI